MELWRWNISTGLNPKNTYFAAGVYTVNLIVSNAVGTDSMLATINILIKISKKTPIITWRKPAYIFYVHH